jgi:hypothetical protein
MGLLGDVVRGLSIVGTTVRTTPGSIVDTANLRYVRVNDDGELTVAASSSGTLINGVAGDDTTENPFRQIDFVPQGAGEGYRETLDGVSREIGPLTADKTYHITASENAWILVGATGGTAVVGDNTGAGTTHIAGGQTYEYVAKAGRLYIQFIKDTASSDGYIAISRVEV